MYGITGYVTGKVAGAVYAVRNGQQVVRAYNPTVLNPKTDNQVAARARLKLLSQLGAAYATIIAMPKEGPVSSRNLFVRKNYEWTSWDGSVANIQLADVLLTNSTIGMPGFIATRSSDEKLTITIIGEGLAMWKQVVTVIVKKTTSQQVMPAASAITAVTTGTNSMSVVMDDVKGDIAVYAYGIRYTDSATDAIFGNIIAPAAEEVAKIITTRQVDESKVVLSETRGVYMEEGQTEAETTGFPSITVTSGIVSTQGTSLSSSVQGSGTYVVGQQVTLSVSQSTLTQIGYPVFVGWRMSGSDEILSTELSYSFTASTSVTIVAVASQQ